MNRNKLFCGALCIVSLGIGAAAGSFALAQPAKEATGQPEMKLPPGWTPEDLQACMIAGTPGKMHEFLANGQGEWHGKTQMWMAPGMDPIVTECTFTVTPMWDNRFMRAEMTCDMPGMGTMHGLGYYGFDNISQEFVANWLASSSTGIMNGKGELSADGKTVTWTYTTNCPMTKKPTKVREIERITGENTKTLEMHGTDPKSGKEYKMMFIEFSRKS